MQRLAAIFCVLLVFSVLNNNQLQVHAAKCDRSPEGHSVPKTPADGRFVLKISGSGESYIPSNSYTVTLFGSVSGATPHKFTGFVLAAEANSKDGSGDVGTFQTLGDSLTKYSDKCPNVVVQANSIQKSEVQVLWTAPAAGSGCVSIKATIAEHHDVWYMDDGPLTKTLCENIEESFDIQPVIISKCCACEEAKYEVTFEGLWSRHTHPKDFPKNGWMTRFSDVIGASHDADYRFWDYGHHASEGLRQLAEHGATRVLESELKAQSNHIRTIIKARGISYPNLTGKTFAVFRVDSRHHLMSLVSMLDPSPDWIVGVSGLELCLSNCSWVESKVLNLYPYDAGTDSGPTYISPDQPTTPRDVIRRIRTNFPNDPRSPFYDPSGNEMKPLARLYLSRQRLYEKTCDSNGGSDDEDSDPCAVSGWGEWTACSVTCGKGVHRRQRWYRNEAKAFTQDCSRKLTQREPCWGSRRDCRVPSEYEPDPAQKDGPCGLTHWSRWSSCSKKCGAGTKVRTRKFKQKGAFKRCHQGSSPRPVLEQTLDCVGAHKDCPPYDPDSEIDEEINCPLSPWSEFTSCSASCGRGRKLRTRKLIPKAELDWNYNGMRKPGEYDDQKPDFADKTDEELQEMCGHLLMEEVECDGDLPSCDISEEEARHVCSMPKVVGPCRAYEEKWFFDVASKTCEPFGFSGCRGNRNNFGTYEECWRVCRKYKEELKRIEKILDDNDDDESSTNIKTNSVNTSTTNLTNIDNDLQDDEGYIGMNQFGGLDTSNQVDHRQRARYPVGGRLPGTRITGDGTLSGYDNTNYPATHAPRQPAPKPEGSRWNFNQRRHRTEDRDEEEEDEYEQPRASKFSDDRYISNPRSNYGHKLPEVGQIIQEADGEIRDCVVSNWSDWSKCSVSCGRGFKQKSRNILQHPINGGKTCPKMLIKRRECNKRRNCDPSIQAVSGEEDGQSYEETYPTWGPGNSLSSTVRQDCILSEWSRWSPCAATCGPAAVQQRTRSILRHPSGGGAPCGPRLDKRSCEIMPCYP